MNESAVGQRKLEPFSWQTDAEEVAAFVGGLAGYLGGLVLVIATNQTHDLPLAAGEVFGTAGAVALTATGIVAGVRRYIHSHRLRGEKRLYTDEINTEVDANFQAGFDVLNNWRRRQEKKNGEPPNS